MPLIEIEDLDDSMDVEFDINGLGNAAFKEMVEVVDTFICRW